MRRTTPPPDRLSRDAAAARAAGMSYGMYKALHPHTGDEEPEPPESPVEKNVIDPGWADCVICGKPFIRRNQDHKCCSGPCSAKRNRQTAAQWYQENAALTVKERSCRRCGKRFRPDHGGKRYCSVECRRIANQESKRKSREQKRDREEFEHE